MQLETTQILSSPIGAGEQQDQRPTVLTIPGLDGSDERHWQSLWEVMPHFKRVEFGNWSKPTLHEWVPELDRAIRESPRPVVLAAHSLGCLAVAWWANLYWSEAFSEKVQGALLVAPPDVDAIDASPRIRDFRPLPPLHLPFPTLLVASTDDPYASIERSTVIARLWGSGFVNAGAAGHLNSQSRLGEWSCGLRLLASMTGHNPNLLIAELGLRTVLA